MLSASVNLFVWHPDTIVLRYVFLLHKTADLDAKVYMYSFYKRKVYDR